MRLFQPSLRTAAAGMIAASLLCCSAGCEGTSASTPATEAPKVAPKPISLVAEGDSTYNFGTVEMGEEFEHVFVLRNAGNDPITIMTGTPSCTTCISSKLDKTELKPNETSRLTTKWKIMVENPQFRQFAPVLATNFTDQPRTAIKLYAEGQVAKRIVVSPSVDRWNVGDTKEGEPTEFEATVISPLVDSFQIESITTTNPLVTVTPIPLPPEKLASAHAKSGYTLRTAIAPNIPVGEFNEKIQLKLLTPKSVVINVNVTARRSGPVQIFGENWDSEKSLLTLGSFDLKQGYTARLNMFTRGVQDELKVEKIVCPDDRFKVEIVADPKFKNAVGERRKYDLFVKVVPSDRAIVHTLQAPLVIELHTNQPLVGKVKLQVRCSALP